MELIVSLAIAALTGAGVWLLLQPRTFQVIIGLALLSYAVNLFIFSMGRLRVGAAAVLEKGQSGDLQSFADPLPQALVLTAIVITLGLTAFVLALSYRSWQLHRHDEVQDDVEDRRIARLAARDTPSVAGSDVDSEDGVDLDDEARETHDETDEGHPAPVHGEGPR